MPLPDPGLAALFESLSDIGARTPVVMDQYAQSKRRGILADREDEKWKNEQDARDALAKTLKQIQGLNAPEGAPAETVDPVTGMLGLSSAIPKPELPQFPMPADPSKVTAADVMAASGVKAPAIRNPRRDTLDKQLGVLRGQMDTPEKIAIYTPLITSLESQREALEKDDKALADAWAADFDKKLKAMVEVYKEGQATLRNNADNSATAPPVIPEKKPHEMTTAELETLAGVYNQQLTKAAADLAALDPDSPSVKNAQKMIDLLNEKMLDVEANYKLKGGTGNLRGSVAPPPPPPPPTINIFDAPKPPRITPTDPGAAPRPTPQIREGTRAWNKATNQILEYRGGQWLPVNK